MTLISVTFKAGHFRNMLFGKYILGLVFFNYIKNEELMIVLFQTFYNL